LPIACFGSALAATGGPMADIVLMVMMQTDMPRDVLGKVFSLRYFVMFLGSALGLLVAPALYTAVGAQNGIVVSAVIFGISGTAGLLRFGIKESKYRPYQEKPETPEPDLALATDPKAATDDDAETRDQKPACSQLD